MSPGSSNLPPTTMSTSCTTALASLSDWMCGKLVAQKAFQYSTVLSTPRHFVELLFWVEDKRFAIHFRVDPIAVTRAIVFNLQRRSALQGASTIPQQVYTIRLSRSHGVSRSLPYKVKQIGWSLCALAAKSRASILNE
jgi:membrane peptidoglycan carboxypeptidase